jgi:large subunit ribosomal protein L19
MSIITEIEDAQKKKETVAFRPGDQVKVHFKVVEGDNERVQIFEGTVIRTKGTGISKMFTVRKISFGIGVERIFPIHSPRIEKIELVKRGRVRHAKLYYLRNLSGKAARIEELDAKQQQQ